MKKNYDFIKICCFLTIIDIFNYITCKIKKYIILSKFIEVLEYKKVQIELNE